MSSDYLELVFTTGGQAVLTNINDRVLWSSDDDPEFRDLFDQDFLTADDAEDIIDYLLTNGYVNEKEAEDMAIAEESEDTNLESEMIRPDD